MLEMGEAEIDHVVHDLLRIVSVLKEAEKISSSEECAKILRRCEMRLIGIRQEIIGSIRGDIND